MSSIPVEFVSPIWCLGPSNELKGYFIERITKVPIHSEQLVRYLERSTRGTWTLSTWREYDGIEVELVGKPVSIRATTWESAIVMSRRILKRKQKSASEAQRRLNVRAEDTRTAFDGLSAQEEELIKNAWMMVMKPFFPNRLALSTDEINRDRISEAMLADSVARGESVAVDQKVAKIAARTNVRPPDALNLWLVENWFHGEKLSSMTPLQRLHASENRGYRTTFHALKMKLTRLGLTSRTALPDSG